MTFEWPARSDQARAADQYFRFRYRDRLHRRYLGQRRGDLEADGVADRSSRRASHRYSIRRRFPARFSISRWSARTCSTARMARASDSPKRSPARGTRCWRDDGRKGPAGDKTLAAIAEGSQDTLASYKEQLSTTNMFYTPQSAADFGAAPALKEKMALVRQFCFDHGLLGENTKSVDDVAIRYPDGSVQGKADRVRLRLRPELHAAGRARKAVAGMTALFSIYAKPGRFPAPLAFLDALSARHRRVSLRVPCAPPREPRGPRDAHDRARWRTACTTPRCVQPKRTKRSRKRAASWAAVPQQHAVEGHQSYRPALLRAAWRC